MLYETMSMDMMKRKMLERTNERYLPFVDTPKISGAEIHYEYLHRYVFVAQFINDKFSLW